MAIQDVTTQSRVTTAPARNALAITPHNTTELAYATRGLYVGGAGDLSVVLLDDTEPVTFVGVPAGVVLPIQVRVVRATGTTATNLLALFNAQ